MKNLINVKEFAKEWCGIVYNPDKKDEELAIAFAEALNKMYQQGLKDGMQKATWMLFPPHKTLKNHKVKSINVNK